MEPAVTAAPPLPDPAAPPAIPLPPLPGDVPATGAIALPGVDLSDWQPLPARGARLAAIGGAIGIALIALAISVVLSLTFNHWQGWLWKLPLALGGGGLLGGWAAWRRHRRTHWRLDDHALAVRLSHLWYRDTRVPRARVQHLDVRRGPLERTVGLATLVVHTAGSRMDAVSLSGLDLADAEALRELLARPDDHDGL